MAWENLIVAFLVTCGLFHREAGIYLLQLSWKHSIKVHLYFNYFLNTGNGLFVHVLHQRSISMSNQRKNLLEKFKKKL